MSQMELELRKYMQQQSFSANIISDLLDRKEITPDISSLRKFKNIPVVVYCNLKGNFDFGPEVFSLSTYLGEAFSAAENFKMYSTPEGDAIVTTRTSLTSTSFAKVKGECWAVPPDTIIALDRYMANGYRTFRKKINFFLTDQTCGTTKKGKVLHPSIPCWMYLGTSDYYFAGVPRGIKQKQVLTPVDRSKRPYYSHYQGLY